MHILQPIFTWPFSAHLKQTISPGLCWQWPLPWLPGSCPLLPLPYCPGCCPLGNQLEAGVPDQQSVMSARLPGSCPLLPLPYCPGCCPLGNWSEAGVPDQESVMSVAVSVIPLISSENLVDICWIMVSNLSYPALSGLSSFDFLSRSWADLQAADFIFSAEGFMCCFSILWSAVYNSWNVLTVLKWYAETSLSSWSKPAQNMLQRTSSGLLGMVAWLHRRVSSLHLQSYTDSTGSWWVL